MKIYKICRKSEEENFTKKDAIPSELEKGIKVEKEHKKSQEELEEDAKQVALDHLAEIPDYYSRLTKMENQAKK